jgi:hypothetical protein
MTEYDNTNRWTLNKNKEKRDEGDKDYNGSVNIDGKEYWLNGWIKNGKNGAFISGTVKAKEPRGQSAPKRSDPISSGRSLKVDMDDDVPFLMEWR